MHPEEMPGEGPSGGEASGSAAELVGGAQDSSAGASSLAGEGSRELFTEDVLTDEVRSLGDAAVLVGRERDDGRRIEVELPPSSEWTASDVDGVRVGSWLRTLEASVPRETLGAPYLEVAGRLFLPSQATTRESP
jgi:hypothetical protein